MKAIALMVLFHSFSSWALTNEEATSLVKKSLENTTINSSRHYCNKGAMTCRTMVQLKDKTTGKPIDMFYDVFYSAERQVGSTCYFIPTAKNSGKYHVLSDLNFDGKVDVTLISPNQAKIVRSFDGMNVMYYDLKMPRVGTTKYLLGKMIESEGQVYIEGTMLDSADANYKENIRVDYFRMNP